MSITHQLTVRVSCEREMLDLAGKISRYAVCGDILTLSGTLGAGKSTFARSFIRSLAGNDELSVPSPTFNLVQLYTETRLNVAHVDAYRMESSDEFYALDIDDYFSHGVTLIEWAERIEDILPQKPVPVQHMMESELGDRLFIEIEEGEGAFERLVHFSCEGTWWPRLALAKIFPSRPCNEEGRLNFLQRVGWDDWEMESSQGDCSFRSYYRLMRGGETAVLMDAPPPVEQLDSFLKMHGWYDSVGVRVPRILAQDIENGYLILEDLGSQTLLKSFDSGEDVLSRLRQVIGYMLKICQADNPDIWVYTSENAWQEVQRYTDWYLPYMMGSSVDIGYRMGLKSEVEKCCERVMKLPQAVCHWDFHCDNWMPTKDGDLALIDFQDSRIGPVTMDLPCLLEDRVKLSEAEIQSLKKEFFTSVAEGISLEDMEYGYNFCLLHRLLKVTGLLVRLQERDGKENMLGERMDVVWQKIEAILAQPGFEGLRDLIVKEPKNLKKIA